MGKKILALRAFALGASMAAGLCMADMVDDEPRCVALGNVPIPRADIQPAERGCEARSLYYDDESYREALACAYAERAARKHQPFAGSAILMMMYANGFGVQRNLLLAKRFACETGGAPAEVSGRLDHLNQMIRDPGDQSFDVCDDASSTYMMGFCGQDE